MASDKEREDRLRRVARRQKLLLRKSRVHTADLENMGGYMLLDERGRIFAGERFNLMLDDVETFLTGRPARRREAINHPAVKVVAKSAGMSEWKLCNRLTLYATLPEAIAACHRETARGAEAYVIEEVSDEVERAWLESPESVAEVLRREERGP